MEQVARAMNLLCRRWLERRNGLTDTIHAAEVIQYHQQRNRQSRESRMKSTEKRL
jgi:hypothetical protein